MTKRKFYKTTYRVEILHEEPMPELMNLECALEEATMGAYSAAVKNEGAVEMDGKQAADALIAQGSNPEFFGLDEEGNHQDDCRRCGEPADDGEGETGLCGNCADRAFRCKLCDDDELIQPEDLRKHLKQHNPRAPYMDVADVEANFTPSGE